MKKILSLDGGGIHGLFSVEILKRIEDTLRAELNAGPDFRLCHYFDMFAGTSTGAIIASFLAWGLSAQEIQALYEKNAATIFSRNAWYLRFWAKFTSDPISDFLRNFFVEDDGKPALLGTTNLKSLLLVVMKNGTTGSSWPITNNPASKYNDRATCGDASNLNIPLWQLVRASAAAPTFFPPQTIQIGDKQFEFIDGGMTPYNNPAYLAYLMATLPEYRIDFPKGEDKMLLVSIGTGKSAVKYGEGQIHDMHLLSHVKAIIKTLMDSGAAYQDLLCRIEGACRHGAQIDSEVGSLHTNGSGAGKAFTYLRYDYAYLPGEITRALEEGRCEWQLDSLPLIPFIQRAGKTYAASAVTPGHFRGFLSVR